MTPDVKPSVALATLAGESIWPLLSLVCHYRARQEGPTAVCIYHTALAAESLLPAMRLRHLLNAMFPDVQVVLPDVFSGLTPEAVQAQLELWLSSRPDVGWVLLSSAGALNWNLALANFVGHPRTQLLGQDSSGAWQRWQRPTDGSGLVMENWMELALAGTDALAIENLLQSQLVTSDKVPSYVARKGSALPLRRLTDLGAANGWDWPATFKGSGLDATGTPAELFAQYVAAGLMELGVENVDHGIRLASQPEARDKETIEIELAVNYRGQLILFDVQLEEEKADDLPQAQSLLREIQHLLGLRQQLRALAPHLILIRPCRIFSDAERATARACELEVIDQAEAPKLFSRLASLLRLTVLPESLAEVEKSLVELVSLRGRRRVFGPESKLTREQETLSGTPVLVDLEKHLAQLCAERGQNWVLWATRTQVFLRLARPASPPEQMPWLIQNSLKRFGRVHVEEIPNGYEAIFPRSDGVLFVLRQALAGYVNRPLDPLIFIQAAPPGPPRPKSVPKAAFSAPSGDPMDQLENVLDNLVKPSGGPKPR